MLRHRGATFEGASKYATLSMYISREWITLSSLQRVVKDMIYNLEPKNDLIKNAFGILVNRLSSYGNRIDLDSEKALIYLLTAFHDCLIGNLDSKYYLASLDPGCGKTEAISSFIQAWREADFKPGGSILIAVNTLDQIESLVSRLNMDKQDFSCFTNDSGLNVLGMGNYNSHKARVLFTTHQMIAARTRDRSFTALTDFRYEGLVRSLRIWDESFVISESIVIGISEIHSLAVSIENHNRRLSDSLKKLANVVGLDSVSDLPAVHIPMSLADDVQRLLSEHRLLENGRTYLRERDLSIAQQIGIAGGRPLVRKEYGGTAGYTLIGAGKPLPEDFAPAIILDASGRVRGTYSRMEAVNGNLVRLPSKTNDYRNMRVRLNRMASGKDTLSDPVNNRPVFKTASGPIVERPDVEWLVLGPKADDSRGFDVERDLRASLPEEIAETVKLHFLHWGRHAATNAYNHIRHVIVVGSHMYPHSGYDALEAAAVGDVTRITDSTASETMRKGEFRHNLLQGVMRSNARNAKDGICGECEVYIIASPVFSVQDIEVTFPGAIIEDLTVRIPPEGRNKQKLIAYLRKRFADDTVTSIPKIDARNAIGCSKGDLSKIVRDAWTKQCLKELNITTQYHAFERIDTKAKV